MISCFFERRRRKVSSFWLSSSRTVLRALRTRSWIRHVMWTVVPWSIVVFKGMPRSHITIIRNVSKAHSYIVNYRKHNENTVINNIIRILNHLSVPQLSLFLTLTITVENYDACDSLVGLDLLNVLINFCLHKHTHIYIYIHT